MLLRLFQKRRLFHKETRLCYVDENFEVPVNAELSKEMLMFVTYIRSQDKSFFKDLIESIPNKRGAYKELYEHANRQLEHLAPGFDEVLVAEIYRSLKKDQKEKWNKKLYDHFETNAAFAENVPSAIDETRNIANEILQNSSIEQRLLKARAEVKELVNETDKTNAQFEKLFIDRVTEEEKQTIDKDQLSLSDIQTLEEKIKALNIDLDNPGEFFDVEELKCTKTYNKESLIISLLWKQKIT
jgi:rRNA maturation endonuclease Nob1